jgi:hypothetical protein
MLELVPLQLLIEGNKILSHSLEIRFKPFLFNFKIGKVFRSRFVNETNDLKLLTIFLFVIHRSDFFKENVSFCKLS